jgi:fructose-1,6-bisphosphatase I
MDDFLQPGTSQVAAGYVIYGTSTMIVYTTGYGVNGFTLNPAIGTFYLSHPNMKFSEDGHIYSINEVIMCTFHKGLKITLNTANQKKRIDLILPLYRSLVSDIHRNMIKGGIYIYPTSSKAKENYVCCMNAINGFIVSRRAEKHQTGLEG